MTENLSILNTMLHTWTDEEVSQAWHMIAAEGKRRKGERTKNMKSQLSLGDTVEYVSKRSGTVRGTIVRIKTKNAVVDTAGQAWNVPMSMLTKV